MEYQTDALGVKFIHWEYQKSTEQISNLETNMRITRVVKPKTDINNGLLFRHTVRLYQNNELTLDCVAEEVFINDGINSFTFAEMKSLMQSAFQRFNSEFEIKIKKEGNPGMSVIYNVKDNEVVQILQLLQKK